MENALSGGHYKRCMRIHKLLYECLARRMIKQYMTDEADTPELRNLAERIIVEDDWEKRKDILDDVINLRNFK